VIIPEYNFSCSGRITGYLISLIDIFVFQGYPSIQVWHPTSSTVYTRVDTECALTDSDISRMTDSMGDRYYLGNVSCTGNNRIEFQSGDVIGYHQGFIRYLMRNIRPMGYTSLRLVRNSPLTTFNTDDVSSDNVFENIQPLIQVMFGKIDIRS